MENSKLSFRVRSVDNLRAIFNIVAGLALVEVVKSTVSFNLNSQQIDVAYMNIPLFISLFFTLLPFHQGASRYLDDKYIRNEISQTRKMEGLVDFFIFIVEGILFYVASLSISQPRFFYLVMIIVLIIDVIWISFVYFSDNKSFIEIKNWLFINLLAVLIISIIIYTPLLLDSPFKWVTVSILFVLRTIVDYSLNWKFYWPMD